MKLIDTLIERIANQVVGKVLKDKWTLEIINDVLIVHVPVRNLSPYKIEEYVLKIAPAFNKELFGVKSVIILPERQ